MSAFWNVDSASTELEIKPSSMYSKEGIARRHLLPLLGHLPINRVDFGVIEGLKTTLAETVARRRKGRTLSYKTINNVLTVLAHPT